MMIQKTSHTFLCPSILFFLHYADAILMYWHFSEYRGKGVLGAAGGDGKDGTKTRSTPKVKTEQQDAKVKTEQQDASKTEGGQGDASDTKKDKK